MVSWKRYRPSAPGVPSRRIEARRRAADWATALPARLCRALRQAGLLSCLTVCAAGCHHAQPGPDSAADSAFVGALADLRRAVLPGGAETTRDSAGRAVVRDSILRKYRVTEAKLEEIARRLAQNPEQASLILHAVDRHVQLALGSAPPHPAAVVPPGMLRPAPSPPGPQTPGASGSVPAVIPNAPATAQSNADARALLNTLRAQSAASGHKIPPSAGAGPPP
jgi:hypothetical protein